LTRLRNIGRAVLGLLAGAALTGCASTPRCALPEATALSSDGPPDAANSMRLARWDLDEGPVWWSETLPASRPLEDYRRAVRALAPDLGQRALMRRSLPFHDPATQRSIRVALAELDASERPDRPVRPVQCLEAALLADQARRMDMVKAPTEVLAYILRSTDGRRLRVYAYTVNSAGIGRLGPLNDAVAPDLASGAWRFAVAFHNHNVFFDEPDLGGVVAPSVPDVQALTGLSDELGMAEAWITNGFDTGVWDAAALHRFARPLTEPTPD